MVTPMMDELAVYGGALLEKGLDVGVKTTDATSILTSMRNSTLVNIITAIVGGGLAYYWRNTDAKGVFAAAFSAASVNNLIEDAAKAAGLPGAGVVGAVRRVSVPFVPTMVPSAGISPSQAAAQSGAPALF